MSILHKKSWWQRLWCLHYWDNGYVIELLSGKKHYECEKCGKEIETATPPISYIGDF